jgi:glycogen debranching enzyme
VLDVLNVDLYAECNEDTKAAKDGIIGRIRYTRVDEHGPRVGEINAK